MKRNYEPSPKQQLIVAMNKRDYKEIVEKGKAYIAHRESLGDKRRRVSEVDRVQAAINKCSKGAITLEAADQLVSAAEEMVNLLYPQEKSSGSE